MGEPVCIICGAADPRWLRHIDRSALDYLTRTMRGYPGPTSLAVNYCDTPECRAEVDLRYGEQGNAAAVTRLLLDQAARLEEQQ